MVSVKVRRLEASIGSRRPRRVVMKRDKAGRLMDVYTVDVNSPTFDSELTYAYRANVAKARRENKRLFGSVDGVKRFRRQGKSTGSKNGPSKT